MIRLKQELAKTKIFLAAKSYTRVYIITSNSSITRLPLFALPNIIVFSYCLFLLYLSVSKCARFYLQNFKFFTVISISVHFYFSWDLGWWGTNDLDTTRKILFDFYLL